MLAEGRERPWAAPSTSARASAPASPTPARALTARDSCPFARRLRGRRAYARGRGRLLPAGAVLVGLTAGRALLSNLLERGDPLSSGGALLGHLDRDAVLLGMLGDAPCGLELPDHALQRASVGGNGRRDAGGVGRGAANDLLGGLRHRVHRALGPAPPAPASSTGALGRPGIRTGRRSCFAIGPRGGRLGDGTLCGCGCGLCLIAARSSASPTSPPPGLAHRLPPSRGPAPPVRRTTAARGRRGSGPPRGRRAPRNPRSRGPPSGSPAPPPGAPA